MAYCCLAVHLNIKPGVEHFVDAQPCPGDVTSPATLAPGVFNSRTMVVGHLDNDFGDAPNRARVMAAEIVQIQRFLGVRLLDDVPLHAALALDVGREHDEAHGRSEVRRIDTEARRDARGLGRRRRVQAAVAHAARLAVGVIEGQHADPAMSAL